MACSNPLFHSVVTMALIFIGWKIIVLQVFHASTFKYNHTCVFSVTLTSLLYLSILMCGYRLLTSRSYHSLKANPNSDSGLLGEQRYEGQYGI